MILFELFWVFFYIGLFTIGGGYAMIPLMQQELVDMRGWITAGTLTDFVGISQVTPGAIAINLATFIGTDTGGFFGAVFATAGIVLPSFIIILAIAKYFSRAKDNGYYKKVMKVLHPVLVALIISAIFSIAVNMNNASGGFDWRDGLLFGGLLAIQLIWKKISPIAILGLSAAAGLALFGLLPQF